MFVWLWRRNRSPEMKRKLITSFHDGPRASVNVVTAHLLAGGISADPEKGLDLVGARDFYSAPNLGDVDKHG